MATSYLSLITSLSSDTLFSSYVSAQDSNWLKVDTFASTAAGSISVLGSNITSLSSSLSALGGNVVSLGAALSSAMLDISALSSAISNVNLSAALGISGSITIDASAWLSSAYSITLSNLGAYDAIFFGPYSADDKTLLDAANPFVTVSGSNIVFTVNETPLSTVTLKYYIDRGREVTQLATPVLNLQDDIAYWDVIPNATEYDVMYNGAVLVSTSTTSVDLSNYFSSDGSYVLSVIAKAVGYFDSNESNTVTYVISTPVADSIYGVSGLYQSSPTLTRTDDAIGMTAAVNSSTGLVSSDFDSVFPWNEATVETIGGNKFLHMPDMWFRVGVDAENRITDVAVSKSQGSTGNWYRVDSFYYGCYGGYVSGGKMSSISGVPRWSSDTRANFRSFASANGSGYHQLDLYHKTVMLFLWYIEWANKDSQSIMRGRDATYGITPVNTGGTDSLSTPSGFNTSTGQMRWHYIEDYLGNLAQFVDGATGASGSSTYYVTADPSKFNDTGTGMNTLAYSYPSDASSSNRCVSALGWDDNNPFLVQPKEQTGTDYTIHFCDSNPASNNVVLYCGANYNVSSATYGVCYFNRNTVSHSNANLGGRLLYKPAA